MGDRYHALYEGLWDDPKLEGATFEAKAFYAFLCANRRQRPSGIFRATDDQLAADTELPVKRVRAYLSDLAQRHRIVRDGAWLFVRAYFERQPKHPRMVDGACKDIATCDSVPVVTSFGEKYSHYSQWSTDRLATLARTSNGFVFLDRDRDKTETETEKDLPTEGPRGGRSPSPQAALTPEDLVAVWNQSAPASLPRVERLSPARRAKTLDVLRAFPERAYWLEVLAEYAVSAFLQGHRRTPGHEGFKADFDWLLAKGPGQHATENFVKVHDGRYRDGPVSPVSAKTQGNLDAAKALLARRGTS